MRADPSANQPPPTSRGAIDYRLVFAASLLLSLWLMFLDPIINRDAIIYLRAAEAYLEQGFAASQAMFGRPFLSVAIGHLHQLTGLPLQYAGLAITSLSYAVMCSGFVVVVRLLGGDRRTQWLAAAVILFHPMINEYRSAIMRDPLYWAFMIMAFRQLLLYAREPTVRHQLGWFCWVMLATLVRFEGALFAALAPLGLLLVGEPGRRLKRSGRLLLLPLSALAAAVVGVLYYQLVMAPGSRLFPAIGQHLRRLANFPAEFADLAQGTGQALLEFTARDDAGWAVVAGLAAILLVNICRALTWPYVILLLWGRGRGLLDRLAPQDRRLLNLHLLIALSYLALFTLGNRFMLERYSGIITLFILPYVVFLLNSIWPMGRRQLGRALVLLLLFGMAADSLYNGGYKKQFVQDAATWIRENTDENASLMSNHLYVAYFSRRKFDWSTWRAYDFTIQDLRRRPELWRNCDYLVFQVKAEAEPEWAQFLADFGLSELTSFDGPWERRLALVRVRPGSDSP